MTLLKDTWEIIKDLKNWPEWKEMKAQVERIPELERRIAELESKLGGGGVNIAGDNVCEHCGSPSLTRIGTRPSKTPFAAIGIKDAIFRCHDCGGETAIEISP